MCGLPKSRPNLRLQCVQKIRARPMCQQSMDCIGLQTSMNCMKTKLGKMFRLPNSWLFQSKQPPKVELPIPNWRIEVESDPGKDIYDTMSELILSFRHLEVMKIRFPDINLSCLVCNIPVLSMYSRTKTHWHTTTWLEDMLLKFRWGHVVYIEKHSDSSLVLLCVFVS